MDLSIPCGEQFAAGRRAVLQFAPIGMSMISRIDADL